MDESTFQRTVLDGLEAQKKKIEQIEKKNPVEEIFSQPDRWPKELKSIAEENTRLKSAANGLDSEVKLLQKQLARMEGLARLESRAAFGDPVKRFCADEEKRNFINALARQMAFGHNQGFKLPDHLQKALTGVDASLGQALIPTAYIPEIYEILTNYGAYNTLRVDSGLSARTNSYPIMTAEPAALIIGAGTGGTTEGSAITPGDFTGTSVSLLIQTIAVLVYASREQLADSTVDMSSQILRSLARSIAKKLDHIAFAADGTADTNDGGYYGIFETDLVHTGSDSTAAAATTVADLTLDDFVATIVDVTEEVLNRMPKWWIHPQLLAKVCLIRDDSGRPIFQNALEAPSQGVGSILGAPVVKVSAAPTADTADAKVAVFGDPDAYVVGIRQDVELASSEHIKFAENQIGFRGILRAGGKHRIPAGNPAGHKPFSVLTLHS